MILRLICSPRGTLSESYRLSEAVLARLRQTPELAGLPVVDVDTNVLPHVDTDYALTLASPADPDAETTSRGALGLSAQLIRQLADARCVVIATPMHNYTVPSALKTWIDHVLRVRHTFAITPQGKVGTLPDRRVYVAIASGGDFSGDPARQPDFLTPYLKAALGTMGLHDLSFFAVEGTVRGEAALAAARDRAMRCLDAHFGAIAA
ncbi:FMN-dependent NADH-azoreductase [plant metagenome]